MDRNLQQAQHIKRLGLVPLDAIQRALSLAQGQKDLCAVLFEQGLLRAESIPQIRGSPGESPHHLRAQAARGLAPVLTQDPHFAPHIDFVLERKEELGRGGMGVVYRVYDKRLKREAALKLLHGTQDAEDVLRFQRESEVMAQLDHPAIPPVYESGVNASGQHFLLMKVIQGETLSARLKSFQFTSLDAADFQELLRILVKVTEAMAFAHSKGVIHRDLKPSNIMIGQYGEVQVMDWGLCRRVGHKDKALIKGHIDLEPSQLSSIGLTADGTVLGTPGYMPPEQVRGEVVDQRADIFAMGSLLTEILTGAPAVVGSSPLDCLIATTQNKISSPGYRNPKLPLPLIQLAEECLAPDPENRWPSMRALGEELLQLLERRDEATKNSPFSARNAIALVTLLLVSGLLLYFASASLSGRVSPSEQKLREDVRRQKAELLRLQSIPLQKRREALSYGEKARALLKRQLPTAELEREFDALDKEVQAPREIIAVLEKNVDLLSQVERLLVLSRARRLFPESNLVHFKVGAIQNQFLDPLNASQSGAILRSGVEDEYYWATKAIQSFQGLMKSPRPKSNAWQEPIELIEKAIQENPKEADFFYIRGRIYLAKKDSQSAVKDFSEAIALHSGNDRFYLFRAKANLTLEGDRFRQYKDADQARVKSILEDAKRSLWLNKEAMEARLIIARSYQLLKQVDMARAYFLSVLKHPAVTQSMKLNIYDGLGSLCELEERYGDAVKHYRDAIKISRFAEWGKALARCQLLSEDYLGAIKTYREVLKAVRDVKSQVNISRAFLALGDVEQAFSEITKIEYQQVPVAVRYDYYYYRGRILLAKGSFEASTQYLMSAINAAPRKLEPRIDLIEALTKLGKLDEARRQIKVAKTQFSMSLEILRAELSLFLASDDYKGAQEACARARGELDRVSVLLELVRVNLTVKDWGSAEANLSKAQQLNPKNAQVFFLRGELDSALNQYRSAYFAYSTAVQLGLGNAEVFIKLGRTAFALNEFASAIIHFTSFIDQTSVFYIEAYMGRGRAQFQQKKWNAALTDFTAVIKNTQGLYYLAFYLRAQTYASLNRKREAISDYQRFLDLTKEMKGLNMDQELARIQIKVLKGS